MNYRDRYANARKDERRHNDATTDGMTAWHDREFSSVEQKEKKK